MREVYAYSPALGALGGGERYFAEVIAALADAFQVTILAHSGHVRALHEIWRIFSLEQKRIALREIANPPDYSPALHNELASLTPEDALFFQVSNGKLIDIRRKSNIVHVQIVVPRDGDPFSDKDRQSFREILAKQDLVIFPSRFVTEENVRRHQAPDTKAVWVHPPVHRDFFVPNSCTENQIVNVGRFTPIKRQRDLIQAFASLPPDIRGKFVLAGPGETGHLHELIALARGLPVEFRVGLNVRELAELYSHSRILWSATGLGQSRFGLVETFGLSIAEAMAGGCVPVAVRGGGVTEIIQDNVTGFLVDDMPGLADRTTALLSSPERRSGMAEAGSVASRAFSSAVFREKILGLFQECGDRAIAPQTHTTS